MRKKVSIFLAVTGITLLLSALFLCVRNFREDRRAEEQSRAVLAVMEMHTVPTAAAPLSTEPPPPAEPSSADPPAATVDGFGYIGCIELPRLTLRLPVMDGCDDARLKLAPCRQFGSARTDDLVIAAHNYPSHFGRLKELSPGDTVRFTDTDGITAVYRVGKLETLEATASETVQYSGYDLVLYTCTIGGRARVAVFCRRV